MRLTLYNIGDIGMIFRYGQYC